MSFGILLSEKEKFEIITILEENLQIQLNEKKFKKIYNKVINFYGKLIEREFKKSNLKLKDLFKRNYVINIPLQYGLLTNDIPGSLIDFKTFKKPKILENKEELIKILNKYRK